MSAHRAAWRRRPVEGASAGRAAKALALVALLALPPPSGEGQGWRQRRELERARKATLTNTDARHLQPFVHNVGYRVLSFTHEGWDGTRGRVDVAVWYPTDEPMKAHTYVYGRNIVKTQLAPDASLRPGRFPLVVYSHGATGSGLSMAFMTERLASQGYVVVGIDYPDKHYGARIAGRVPWKPGQIREQLEWVEDIATFQLNEGGKDYRRSRLAYRPRIARAAIDLMLKENADAASPFHRHLDPDRIALVGHSFGAWTSLLVAGADAQFHDSRTKAVVALSGPCNEGVYQPNEIGQIQVPVMFMFGGEEPKVGRGNDKKLLYDRANPPRFLLEIEGADHLAFSGGIREEYSQIRDYAEKDPRRAAMVVYTIAFFDAFLRGDASARARLETTTDSVASYWKDWGGDPAKGRASR